MIKLNKRAVRITAATLATTLTLGTVAALAAIKPKTDSYTVYADDGYYSETTYYLTEEAYNEHSAENATATTQTKSTKQAMSSSQAENDDEQFVVAAEKTVWVKETSDENGIILDSNLLTKEEVEKLKLAGEKSATTNIMPTKSMPIQNPEEEIDNESVSYNAFSMVTKLTHNIYNGRYYAYSDFSWADTFTWPFEEEKEAETWFRDCIAITWGGNETLVEEAHSMSAQYYGGSNVEIIQSVAKPTLGYAWEFHEQQGAFAGNKELQNGHATVTLLKQGAYENKHAQVTFTYIHSYGIFNPGIKVGINKDGAEASLTITGSEDYWKIETSLGDILY